jgi:hypothetical protein
MVSKSKREAISRYDAKTYRNVLFKLRKEDDAEILKDMDEALERGVSRREWLQAIYKVYKENK